MWTHRRLPGEAAVRAVDASACERSRSNQNNKLGTQREETEHSVFQRWIFSFRFQMFAFETRPRDGFGFGFGPSTNPESCLGSCPDATKGPSAFLQETGNFTSEKLRTHSDVTF